MKMQHDGLATLLFFTAAGITGLASSATFEQLDANKDGKVSAVEAGKDIEVTEMWSTVDTDKDGAIDRTEFSAFESLRGKPEESGEAPSEESPSGETGGAM
jgi:hypothetical protein